MSIDLPRPCTIADVIAIASDHRFSWGNPRRTEHALDWPADGPDAGFDPSGVVLADPDWDLLPTDEAVRYVILHDGDRWVLRWGKTSSAVLKLHQDSANKDDPYRAERANRQLADGLGTHRLMLSVGEAKRATQSGHAIKSGYIYRIRRQFLAVD